MSLKETKAYDLVIVGEELGSWMAAVVAAQQGKKVICFPLAENELTGLALDKMMDGHLLGELNFLPASLGSAQSFSSGVTRSRYLYFGSLDQPGPYRCFPIQTSPDFSDPFLENWFRKGRLRRGFFWPWKQRSSELKRVLKVHSKNLAKNLAKNAPKNLDDTAEGMEWMGIAQTQPNGYLTGFSRMLNQYASRGSSYVELKQEISAILTELGAEVGEPISKMEFSSLAPRSKEKVLTLLDQSGGAQEIHFGMVVMSSRKQRWLSYFEQKPKKKLIEKVETWEQPSHWRFSVFCEVGGGVRSETCFPEQNLLLTQKGCPPVFIQERQAFEKNWMVLSTWLEFTEKTLEIEVQKKYANHLLSVFKKKNPFIEKKIQRVLYSGTPVSQGLKEQETSKSNFNSLAEIPDALTIASGQGHGWRTADSNVTLASREVYPEFGACSSFLSTLDSLDLLDFRGVT